ncbi:hypothetical protein ACLOJK_020357 [Asimina triloba]
MQWLSFLPLDHLHLRTRYFFVTGPPDTQPSLLPSVKTSLPLATHLSPSSSRDLELQICTLRPSVSPYSCLPLAISLFNLAQSLSLNSLSLSIPLSFDLNVPSFDLCVSKPHDVAFKRLTTTTWIISDRSSPRDWPPRQDYQRRGDPLYVLLCYWVAVVGAGLVKPEDILEGVASLRISSDIEFEEQTFITIMSESVSSCQMVLFTLEVLYLLCPDNAKHFCSGSLLGVTVIREGNEEVGRMTDAALSASPNLGSSLFTILGVLTDAEATERRGGIGLAEQA